MLAHAAAPVPTIPRSHATPNSNACSVLSDPFHLPTHPWSDILTKAPHTYLVRQRSQPFLPSRHLWMGSGQWPLSGQAQAAFVNGSGLGPFHTCTHCGEMVGRRSVTSRLGSVLRWYASGRVLCMLGSLGVQPRPSSGHCYPQEEMRSQLPPPAAPTHLAPPPARHLQAGICFLHRGDMLPVTTAVDTILPHTPARPVRMGGGRGWASAGTGNAGTLVRAVSAVRQSTLAGAGAAAAAAEQARRSTARSLGSRYPPAAPPPLPSGTDPQLTGLGR